MSLIIEALVFVWFHAWAALWLKLLLWVRNVREKVICLILLLISCLSEYPCIYGIINFLACSNLRRQAALVHGHSSKFTCLSNWKSHILHSYQISFCSARVVLYVRRRTIKQVHFAGRILICKSRPFLKFLLLRNLYFTFVLLLNVI